MDIDGIRSIVECSKMVMNWSLSIVAGSIALLVGTDYLKPKSIWMRLPYLLFIGGWIALGRTIVLGYKMANRGIAAELFSDHKNTLEGIVSVLNSEYRSQMNSLYWGIGFFSSWLMIYVLWIIFSKSHVQNPNLK